MLLLNLRLRNFLIYENVDLDLRDIKLASIIGQFSTDRRRSNGSGKTALLESIRYALYDQTRSKLKLGIVRAGATESSVELEFLLGSRRFRVRRCRDSTGNSDAHLWIDGRPAGDKVKIVNDTIEKAIGLDSELFDNIYFFKQGDQFGFAEANPSDRKAALAKVFRMDSLLRCAEVARERKKDAEIALVRAKAVAENLFSRQKSLPPYQQLQEQELATSGIFATAMQMREEFAAVEKDNIFSYGHLEQMAKEFEEEVDKDLVEVRRMQNKVQETNRQVARLQQSIQSNTALCDRELENIKQLEEKIKAAPTTKDVEALKEKADTEVRKLSSDLSVVESKIATLRKTGVDKIVGQDCPVCHQFVKTEHAELVLKHCKEESAKLEKSRGEIHDALNKKKIEYQQYVLKAKAATEAEQARAHISLHQQMLATHQDGVKKQTSELDEILEQRTQLYIEQSNAIQRVDTALIEKTRGEIKTWEAKLRKLFSSISPNRLITLRGDVDKAFVIHQNILSAIKQHKEIDAEIAVNEIALKKATRDFEVYNHLTEAFGKNGIQALLIENAIGVIEVFANEILSQMQTRFVISLKTQKETKAGELKESLDIIVFDNGSEKAFESYSGGERTLINIALRLALSRVVGSLHGVKMHSLFLDEVLGALDAVNREEVVKVISYLSKTFDQIFIVSHTDEIKDIIDTAIVITRDNDKSSIALASHVA